MRCLLLETEWDHLRRAGMLLWYIVCDYQWSDIDKCNLVKIYLFRSSPFYLFIYCSFFFSVKPQLLDFNRLCSGFQPAFLLSEGGGALTITTSQVTLVYVSKRNAEELCEMFYDIFYNRSIWPNPVQVHCWRSTVESPLYFLSLGLLFSACQHQRCSFILMYILFLQ